MAQGPRGGGRRTFLHAFPPQARPVYRHHPVLVALPIAHIPHLNPYLCWTPSPMHHFVSGTVRLTSWGDHPNTSIRGSPWP